MMLLIAIIIVLIVDSRREWKKYTTNANTENQIHRTTITAYPLETPFGPGERIEHCRTCHDNLPKKCPESVEYSPKNSKCPAAENGCTVCHGGRGESLSMATTGHLPESIEEYKKWTEHHGWFRDFSVRNPIHAKSFSESGCLSCHKNGYEFPPSAAHPIPLAENLRRGFLLIQKYNCAGCHLIERSGFSTSGEANRRKISLAEVGLRMNYTTILAYLKSPSMENPHAMMPELFESNETLHEPQRREIKNQETRRMEAIARLLAGMCGENALSRTDHSESINISQSNPQRGREIFIISGCAACHPRSDIGFFSKQFFAGPCLDHTARWMNTPTSYQWLASIIRNPSTHFPNCLMPQIDISQFDDKYPSKNEREITKSLQEINDLIAFLLDINEHPENSHNEKDTEETDFESNTKNIVSEYEIHESPNVLMGEYGCTACHEIPEISNRRIGPNLSEWGKKATNLFDSRDSNILNMWNITIDDEDSFLKMTASQQRLDGLTIAKLRTPRSVEVTSISEKHTPSKMGRFATMTSFDRKDIAIFLTGLKHLPNASSPNYHDNEHRKAITDGEEIFHRYGCLLCHAVVPEYRKFREIESGSIVKTFGFSDRNISIFPEMIIHDDPSLSVFHSLIPVRILQKMLHPGEESLLIANDDILSSSNAYGGEFTSFLKTHLMGASRKITADERISQERFPPFLFRVGRRIQPSQLERWLANPDPYRPTLLIQMPRFLFSSSETRKLANYFVATEMEWEQMYGNVSSNTNPSLSLPASDEIVPITQDDCMNIVSLMYESKAMIESKEFCGKCHSVENPSRTAPNLRIAAKRLRPSALQEWIAAPERVRPLTTMPAFFPESQPKSSEKIDKMVRFLLTMSP